MIMYFYFISFLHTEMVHVIQILPHGRQVPVYPTQSTQYHGCWWFGDARSHGISSQSIEPVQNPTPTFEISNMQLKVIIMAHN